MSERPYSQEQFDRAGEVMDAAALNGFDQQTQEVFAEAIADAYHAGRIAQAEVDARIADAIAGQTVMANSLDGCKVATAIAAAIRANAAKIGEGGE